MANLIKSNSHLARKPNPKQAGFGLLVFVAAVGVVALTLVLGMYTEALRATNNMRESTERAKLTQAAESMKGFYYKNLTTMDAVTLIPTEAEKKVVEEAGDLGLVKVVASEPKAGSDGIYYRRWILYFPSRTNELNPPKLDQFRTTGVWAGCANPSVDCVQPQYVEFSSEPIQREQYKIAANRLRKVVLKAQSYFKARWMQDPEKSLVPNYFRVASNDCSITASEDLGCVDTYTQLATTGYPLTGTMNDVAMKLMLSPDELMSPWGSYLELSNMQDSEYQDPPYTLSVRYRTPQGTYLVMKAVQQS